MGELQIEAAVLLDTGKISLRFENGTEVALYKSEVRKLFPQAIRFSFTKGGDAFPLEGMYIPEELYQKILYETVGLRAKKRAMFLLEKQDRTERQLFDKLKQSGYPEECITEAIAYVKNYHYIDDLRYAKTYIRYHQKKKSWQKLKIDLMTKGVKKDTIDQALEEEFNSNEQEKIRLLLEKRRYHYDSSDTKEMQRSYQFLLRRGFKSSDVLKVMKYGCNCFDD